MQKTIKILQSESVGVYWNNISYDLPNIPVNNIKYDQETDILFAATDVGLFYLKEVSSFGADQTWERFGDFPLTIASDIKINNNTRELIVATYGRGIWRADLSCFYNEDVLQIIGPVTWNSIKSVVQDVEILYGAQLTITGETKISSDAKITVRPGGKLIIDGGTLTNKCGSTWKGITVLGNPNLSQFNESDQGVLELINGALIENAEIAIKVGNPGPDEGGGIVKIEDAEFKNCVYGICFYAYSGDENRSYIYNSTFETTEDLYNMGKTPNSFIAMYDVGTVDIKGNTFINHRQIDPYGIHAIQGKGIKSIDADFKIEPYCTNTLISPCPVEDLIKNSFENLYVAVEVQGTGSASVCDIDDNEFTGNFVSVHLNSVDGAELTSNDIDITNSYGSNSPIGIYAVNSTGFHIEDNNIDGSGSSLAVGIDIEDCQSVNEVYKNYLSNLWLGVWAAGDNVVPIGFGPLEGLQIICNEFDNNMYQIFISSQGIATNQGSLTLSAGNKFTPECIEGNQNEIWNEGLYINYFAESDWQTIPNCNYHVNTFTGNDNECPSKLDPGMPSERMSMLLDSISDTETELLAVIDGGDTEAMNETVENAEPDEALKLRNTLLSESPFLSDTVMINSTSVEDVLPAIMLKQVLVENPSAAKSTNVQNALDNRQDTIPEYMRDEINLGRYILSEKEELQSNLSGFIHEREDLVNRRMSQLMRDSFPESSDTLETLLIDENSLLRSYQLVNFYMTKGNIADAQTVFTNIPQNYELSNKQQNEYDKLSELFSIQVNLKNNEQTWFEMSYEQKQIIYTLSEDSTTQAGMRSRAVLSLVDNIDYGYPIPEIDGGDKGMNPEPIVYPETFTVYPNPANDYFIIEYALAEKENVIDTRIVLFDDAGTEVMNFDVKTRVNQLLAECEDLKEGVYWCRKLNRHKVSAEEKVIIDRGGISEFNNDKTSGYELLNNTGSFKIYPNPAKDYFIVSYDLKDAESGNILILITDSRGRKIKEIKPDKNSNKQTISSSDWAKGVYTISLRVNENIIETVKLIIK